MSDQPVIRLNKVLRELNISLDRAVEFLSSKGHEIEARPTTKIAQEVYNVLLDEFQTDKSKRDASAEISELDKATATERAILLLLCVGGGIVGVDVQKALLLVWVWVWACGYGGAGSGC